MVTTDTDNADSDRNRRTIEKAKATSRELGRVLFEDVSLGGGGYSFVLTDTPGAFYVQSPPRLNKKTGESSSSCYAVYIAYDPYSGKASGYECECDGWRVKGVCKHGEGVMGQILVARGICASVDAGFAARHGQSGMALMAQSGRRPDYDEDAPPQPRQVRRHTIEEMRRDFE